MARFTQSTHEHHTDTGIISRLNSLVQNSISLSMELFRVIFSTKNGVVWCWPNHQPCWVTAFFTATVS